MRGFPEFLGVMVLSILKSLIPIYFVYGMLNLIEKMPVMEHPVMEVDDGTVIQYSGTTEYFHRNLKLI